jgi:hypothetical protein
MKTLKPREAEKERYHNQNAPGPRNQPDMPKKIEGGIIKG